MPPQRILVDTWSRASAESRYSTGLSPISTRTAHEIRRPFRPFAAAAPKIVAGSDVLLPEARLCAAGSGAGGGAALQALQQIQLSRELR